MRAALIASVAVAAACGNGMVQIENVVPLEGPLDGTMYEDFDVSLSFSSRPSDADEKSYEVDTGRGYCVSAGSGTSGDVCVQEDFGPHYALVTIANHNDPPAVGGVTGTAQLNRYSVEIRGLSKDAPQINGYNGFLGVSIRPGRGRTFPVVLMGMDGKAEFRNAGADTPHRYGIDFTFKGSGGLTITGGTTVLVGEFNKCPEDSTPSSFCSPF